MGVCSWGTSCTTAFWRPRGRTVRDWPIRRCAWPRLTEPSVEEQANAAFKEKAVSRDSGLCLIYR